MTILKPGTVILPKGSFDEWLEEAKPKFFQELLVEIGIEDFYNNPTIMLEFPNTIVKLSNCDAISLWDGHCNSPSIYSKNYYKDNFLSRSVNSAELDLDVQNYQAYKTIRNICNKTFLYLFSARQLKHPECGRDDNSFTFTFSKRYRNNVDFTLLTFHNPFTVELIY